MLSKDIKDPNKWNAILWLQLGRLSTKQPRGRNWKMGTSELL